jgi:hypothetical protein
MGFLYFVIGIICSIAVAQIARSKGREAILWFIFGLFAWPIALILVLALPSLVVKPLSQQDKITKLLELEKLKESGSIDEETYKKFRFAVMGDESKETQQQQQISIEQQQAKDAEQGSGILIFTAICFGFLAIIVIASAI